MELKPPVNLTPYTVYVSTPRNCPVEELTESFPTERAARHYMDSIRESRPNYNIKLKIE